MDTSPGSSSHTRVFVFVAIIVCAISFGFQGSRALWSPDEGIFGEVAKEMYDAGEYLIPTLHHDPYPEKPPLMYWCMIAGMKVVGRNEWGLRLAFGFSLIITAWLTGLLGAEMFGRREGLLAGLFYGTMLVPAIAANISRPDALLVMLCAAAMYCYWKSIHAEGGRAALWKVLMCGAFGLGFLAKGPAILVIAAPMFVHLILTGRALKYFLTPWAVVCVVVFFATGLGWYALFIRRVPGSAAYFWDNEVWGRLFTNTYRRHHSFGEAFTVYGPTLLGGALPWAVLWPYWFYRARAEYSSVAWWKGLRERPAELLLVLWIALPVIVFGLAKSKLHLYVLPVFPAMAIASARAWTIYSTPDAERFAPLPRWAFRIAIASAVIILAAKYVAAHDEVMALANIQNERNERAIAAGIVEQLPPEFSKVYVVNEELNGCGFYTQQQVLDATLHEAPYPTFTQAPKVSELLKDAAKTNTQVAFISRSKKAMLDQVTAVIREQGWTWTERSLPFKHSLLLCVKPQ